MNKIKQNGNKRIEMKQYAVKVFLVVSIVLAICSCEKEEEKQAILHGIVTDFSTSEPIQGAAVILFTEGDDLEQSHTTGADGRYTILMSKPINSNTDFFRVAADGYEPIEQTANVNVALGEIKQLDFQLGNIGSGGVVGGGVLSSIQVKFYNAQDFMGKPHFVLSNLSSSSLSNVTITMSLILGGGKTWSGQTISARGSKSYTNNNNAMMWYEGDKIIVTINGKTKEFLCDLYSN